MKSPKLLTQRQGLESAKQYGFISRLTQEVIAEKLEQIWVDGQVDESFFGNVYKEGRW